MGTYKDNLIAARDSLREELDDHAKCANPDHLAKIIANLEAIDKLLANVGAEAEDGNPFFMNYTTHY